MPQKVQEQRKLSWHSKKTENKLSLWELNHSWSQQQMEGKGTQRVQDRWHRKD